MADLPQLSRIPTQPNVNKQTNYMYPTDLTGSGREIYMVINVCTYNAKSILNNALLQPFASIALPIPIKINDQTTVNWEQDSVISMGASVMSGILDYLGRTGRITSEFISKFGSVSSSVASLTTGKSINPGLFMLFKTQNFKEHVFQWLFAPQNQQDTDELDKIINLFKASMLPSIYTGFNGALGSTILNYPNIFQINFSQPDSQSSSYLYPFKPAAVVSCAIDWSPGATPGFFNNGAPALVAITLQLKEIELWFSDGVGVIV